VKTASLNVTKLAIAGLVVGLSFIGWVARGSLAQDPAPSPPPPTEPGATAPAPIPGTQDTKPHKGPEVLPLTKAEPNVPIADSPPQLTAPTLQTHDLATEIAAELGSVVAAPVDAAPPVANPAVADDPEKAAQAFVEENQKRADAELKSLKEEAEKLRTRLRKIEGGIKSWESLKRALQKSRAVDTTALPSGGDMHDDVQYFSSVPDFPWANTQAAAQRARMRAMGIEPPPPPSLEGKRVMILCNVTSGSLAEFPSLERDLPKDLAAILRTKVKKITVIEPDKVATWVEAHPHWTDPADAARDFDADIAIRLEVEQFRSQTPGDLNMVHGESKVHITVFEMQYPKNSKDKPIKDQPKEAPEVYDEYAETTFPDRGPLPIDTGTGVARFTHTFLKLVVKEVSWHFVPHREEGSR
jgi:hypothetical protein